MKELIEFAAIAIGLTLVRWNDGNEPYSNGQGFILEDNSLWNPLTNSDQALNLCASLKINLEYDDIGVEAIATTSMFFHGAECPWRFECFASHESKNAAVRHAIVFVAAKIGKLKSTSKFMNL